MFKLDLIPFSTNACNSQYLSNLATVKSDGSTYSSNLDLTNYQIEVRHCEYDGLITAF